MIVTKQIDYFDGKTRCIGFMAYEDQHQNPRPCVMIAPDWSGRGEAACDKARIFAMMGYVGFAIDVYGDAQVGETNDQRTALMMPFIEDRSLLAARMQAAFNAVCALPVVNPEKIAVIGFCFGGLCALDLARSGVNVKGAISFHGLLFKPEGLPAHKIKAKVLVLHGYDDPMVKPEQVQQFAQEMTQRKVDWQIHMYGNTTHAFTNPLADDPGLGLKYNKTADARSFISAEAFLKEIF